MAQREAQTAPKPCGHTEDDTFFANGKCQVCGYVCDHEPEWHEVVDTRDTIEYWGAPRVVGDRWTRCTLCGEDVSYLYEED